MAETRSSPLDPRNPAGSASDALTLDTLHPPTPTDAPATHQQVPLGGTTAAVVASKIVGAAGMPSLPGYEMLGELGEGGMGVVYKARQSRANRLVALKMIRGGYASLQDKVRFQIEAEAVASLQHANIVQLYEVGEQAGQPFFSLEFCGGGALDKKLKDWQPTPSEAAELVETLARAMNYAHSRGVVHRDLKPANILLAADGTPKVTDFGLAKRLDSASEVSKSGAVMGTPAYMAPEQAEGKTRETGPSADVYALGAMLFELLTRRPPFRGPTTLETLRQVLCDEPVPPTRLNPGVPRDLETICLKCLQKEPTRRYRSAEALADELRRFLTGEPITARPVGGWERALKWMKRRPAVAALLMGLILVTTLGVAGILWKYVEAEEQRRRAEDRSLAATTAEASARGEAQRAAAAEQKAKDEAKRAAEAEQKAKDEAKRATTAEQTAKDEARRAAAEETNAKRELARAEGLLYAGNLLQTQLLWDSGSILAALERLGDAGRWPYRGWEYAHLRQRYRETYATFRGHETTVEHVCFSPDGKQLASADDNQLVIVWDAATGKALHTINNAEGVCFRPDGKPVTFRAAAQAVKLRDATTGQEILSLKENKPIIDLSYSPDGKHLSGIVMGPTPAAKVWDAATGDEVFNLKGHKLPIRRICYSPDGKKLATGDAGSEVKVWDAATGKELHSLFHGQKELRELGGVWVREVCFSPDSKRLAAAGDNNIVKVWEAATGKELLTYKGHSSSVFSVHFSPDGRQLASTGSDFTVRLWDSTTGKDVHTFLGHTNSVMSVRFSPDGKRLASGGYAPSADGSLSGDVKLWDIADGQDVLTLEGHTGNIYGVCISPDGKRLASCEWDRKVKVWDLFSGVELLSFDAHKSGILRICYSRDGKQLLTASDDRTVKIWDAATGKQLLDLKDYAGPVKGLVLSPDGKQFATTNMPDPKTMKGGEIRLRDTATGKVVLAIPTDKLSITSLAFSPDGKRLASGCNDDSVQIWDAASGAKLLSFHAHIYGVFAVCFSPDGKRFASGGADELVRLWDAATGKELLALKGHTELVRSLCFNHDGTRLVSGAGETRTGEVKIWDAVSGQELLALKGHTFGVTSLCFSPDGRRLVSGSEDRTIRVWESSAAKDEQASDLAFLARLNDVAARLRYHRTEALDCEEKQQWFAAAFHLRQLLDAKEPDANQLRQRLKQCETKLKKAK